MLNMKNKIEVISNRQNNSLSNYPSCNNGHFMNVNTHRCAFRDSGPRGFSHFETMKQNREDRCSSEDSASLSHAFIREQAEGRQLDMVPFSSPPRARASLSPACTGRAPEQIVKKIVSSPVSPRSPRDEPLITTDNVNHSATCSDRLVSTQERLSMAKIAGSGEWKTQKQRKNTKSRNRFERTTGMAGTNPESKFKAADIKLPLFINNVDKETSKEDIIDYIQKNTGEEVSLKLINSKDGKKRYNSFIMYVSKSKLSLFLDKELWPEGVTFRRFVPYKPPDVVRERNLNTPPNK